MYVTSEITAPPSPKLLPTTMAGFAVLHLFYATFRRFRLTAQRREGGAGGDHFGVHLEFDDRGAFGGNGFLEGRGKFLGARALRRERAVGAGERREIGVLQVGAGDAAREAALLMHANRAVHRIVEDKDDRPWPFGERS